ncbi:serine hydrolase domain-containing protein [Morganella morganii]|nr:beta-lactamase family protein [Morganella morganii]
MPVQNLSALLQDVQPEGFATAFYFTGAGCDLPDGAAHGGLSKHDSTPVTPDTPVRIASNTKTFTAAAVLRLYEQQKLSLSSPVAPLLSPQYVRWLTEAGYDLNAITVLHLLSHSSGLYDHADEKYIRDVLADPGHLWTRDEQIRLYVSRGYPLMKPGLCYLYSDTGYLLLGDIIERITQLPLAQAVRQLLRFDMPGMESAYWELEEPAPAGLPPRAHQYLGNTDGDTISPTMDLWGGGGLIMSVSALAVFMANLFEGRIFDKPETLEIMMKQGSHDGAEAYRCGVMVTERDGQTLWYHLGFWGTAAYYHPQKKIAAAGFVNNRDTRPWLMNLLESSLCQDDE